MSILRCLTDTKNNLPDGLLSKKMPQRDVREVLEAIHNENNIKNHDEYTKYNPTIRVLIGKVAYEIGVAAAVRKLNKQLGHS